MTKTSIGLQELRRKLYARRRLNWLGAVSMQWLYDTLGLFNGYRVRAVLRKALSAG